MLRLLLLSLAVMTLTTACSSAYQANVCGQYLSSESITPNYSGRGRSCVVEADSKANSKADSKANSKVDSEADSE